MNQAINIMQRFMLLTLICVTCINLSREQSSPHYCSATVVHSDLTRDQLVDAKLGTSRAASDNKGIKVYRKPNNETIKPEEYIDYLFDLETLGKIEVNQKEPKASYHGKEYINITLVNKSGTVSIECIIPKEMQILGKLKSTGWTASYPFDTINKVIIHHCSEVQEQLDDHGERKSTLVEQLDKSLSQLEAYKDKDKQVESAKSATIKEVKALKDTLTKE